MGRISFPKKCVTNYRTMMASDVKKMLHKLSGACCAVWSMVHISNINTLKSIYCAYFHAVIQYAVFFGDNSSNSGKIFTLHKRIIRIIADARHRTSCRGLIKQIEILNFINSNENNFRTNSFLHNINTKNKHHLHRPNANLPFFPKSTFFADIRIFNNLRPSVTILKNHKGAVRKYLHVHCCYCVHELSMCQDVV